MACLAEATSASVQALLTLCRNPMSLQRKVQPPATIISISPLGRTLTSGAGAVSGAGSGAPSTASLRDASLVDFVYGREALLSFQRTPGSAPQR